MASARLSQDSIAIKKSIAILNIDYSMTPRSSDYPSFLTATLL